jgi:hypothetical protein
MAEREDERYIRELLERLHGVQLRKLVESRVSGVKSPDYEVLSDGKRAAVLEVKLLGRIQPTAENGWERDGSTGFMTREDNSVSRVGKAIHQAYKQLSTYPGVRVLAFVNDDSMDFLTLREALEGYLVYGTEETGLYKNLAGRKVAEGRIRDEKHGIDLYLWINRYEGRRIWRPTGILPHEEAGKPFFLFASDAGYALARSLFNVPEVPKPERDPNEGIPTLPELLLREALGGTGRRAGG